MIMNIIYPFVHFGNAELGSDQELEVPSIVVALFPIIATLMGWLAASRRC